MKLFRFKATVTSSPEKVNSLGCKTVTSVRGGVVMYSSFLANCAQDVLVSLQRASRWGFVAFTQVCGDWDS